MFQLSGDPSDQGNTSSPGMTQSEATEKPVARALGGIASDSAVKNARDDDREEAEISARDTRPRAAGVRREGEQGEQPRRYARRTPRRSG